MNFATVASGGADSYYEFGLHAWDMAAGDLIVREAGGVVIDTTGNACKILIFHLMHSFSYTSEPHNSTSS